VNNLQYAKANYKGVHGVELHFDADWTIPYKGNEDRMSFRKCNTIVRLGWSDARMLKEYGVDCILTKQNEQGYNYNRRID
jgi:hypothetical protein